VAGESPLHHSTQLPLSSVAVLEHSGSGLSRLDLSTCRLVETCSEAAQSVVGGRYSSSGDHALCLCSGGGKIGCLEVGGWYLTKSLF